MLQSAWQDPFVQLVKVNELDQVREFGVPVVKAEECLPVVLARQDLEVFDLLVVTQCEDERLWVALAVTEEEEPIHEPLLFNDPVRLFPGDPAVKPVLRPVNHCTEGGRVEGALAT